VIRRIALIAPVLLLAVFVAMVLVKRPAASPFPSRVGNDVPVFDLPGLDARHPGLADGDLKRGTVTVVNLFASWCLPCRAEAAQIASLSARGIVVHGIAVSDKAAAAQAFLKAHGDPFARVGIDPDWKVAKAFGAAGIPETFVIDGRGRIVFHHVGDVRAETVPQVVAAVRAAR
jgi:cytochrome c biogenesis protein CcmG/thiol:disulfide interchange protein DsbE